MEKTQNAALVRTPSFHCAWRDWLMIHALICTEASNMQLCYKLTSTLQRRVKDQKVHILQKQVNINFTSLHIQADVCKKKKTKWRIIQAD